MRKEFNTIYFYLIFVFLFNLLIWITPILKIWNIGLSDLLFHFFSFFCHQKFERSFCFSSHYYIGDCDIENGFIYQFPVCARDTSFYLAMLIGGVIFLFMGKKNSLNIPSLIYLFLFILPLGLDGVTQLLGLRESTNFIRVLTGLFAGIIIPFYIVPIINIYRLKLYSWKRIKSKRGIEKENYRGKL